MFDRKIYFDSVRASLFGGAMNDQQVKGQEGILTRWEANHAEGDLRHLAYMLATTFHETAYKMWPITEYGSQSYLQGKDYWPYIGRGFVQLTWEDNYRKATQKLGLSGNDDLVKYPDRALDLQIATDVMFIGMDEGWFTGKKLRDYFDADTDDSYNARRIINGTDKASTIAGYHGKFLAALQASGVEDDVPAPSPPPGPEPLPVLVAITQPVGAHVTVTVNGEIVVG